MADSKSRYSSASSKYINKTIKESKKDMNTYQASKKREEKWNVRWKRESVNINEIVDKFAPGAKGYRENGKFIYSGDNYDVIADMSAGYLRILDRKTRQHLKLNGKPGNNDETHFKIKRKEEK